MSFGWSASDVALAVQVLNQACKALRQTGGSRQEYAESIAFISGLEQTLRNVSTANNVLSQTEIAVQTQALAQEVGDVLHPFLSQIAKYEEPLTSHESHRKHRKLKSKLEWGFSGRQKMHDFTDKVALPLASINANLGMQVLQLVTALKDRLPQILQQEVVDKIIASQPSSVDPNIAIAVQSDKIEQVLTEVRGQAVIQQDTNQSLLSEMTKWQSEILMLREQVEKLQLQSPNLSVDNGTRRNIEPSTIRVKVGGLLKLIALSTSELLISLLKLLWPFVMMILSQLTTAGRRLPLLLVSDSIVLEDALGRTCKLPYRFFQHWDMLQTYLVHSFQGVPGLCSILRGHYVLTLASNGRSIQSRQWNMDVKSGSRVVMSLLKMSIGKQRCMICRRMPLTRVDETDDEDEFCSRCHENTAPEKSLYAEPDYLFVRSHDGYRDRKDLSEQRRDNLRELEMQKALLPLPPALAPEVLQQSTQLHYPEPNQFALIKRVCFIELTDPLRILDTISSCAGFLSCQPWVNPDDVKAFEALHDAISDLEKEIRSVPVTILDFPHTYEIFCQCASHMLSALETCIQEQKVSTNWQQFGWHRIYPGCPTCMLQQAFEERMSTSLAGIMSSNVIVIIKSLSGKIIPLRMRKGCTIEDLKLVMLQAEGLPVQQQCFVYRGRKLHNERTIESYGIKPSNYIHLVLPFRGGSY